MPTPERYELISLLAEGRSSTVYVARDTTLDREVALKIANGKSATDGPAGERFLAAAAQVARLSHPHILQVIDFGRREDAGGAPFVAMPLLRGQTLAAMLEAGTPLTAIEKLELVMQVCEGLQYAHNAGMVHGTVCPANIWYGDDRLVKLLNLAAGGDDDADEIARVRYQSPEQVAGDEVGSRSDVFSTGAVLYELLAGHPLIDAETPAEVRRRLQLGEWPRLDAGEMRPQALVQVVNRALSRDPLQRFARAAEMAVALEHVSLLFDPATGEQSMFLADLPLPPAPNQPIAPVPSAQAPTVDHARNVRRKGLALTAALTVVVAVLAVLLTRVLSVAPGPVPGPGGPGPVPGPGPEPGPGTTPDPPPPSKRMLVIASAPAGAQVLFDGRDQGVTTPYELDASEASTMPKRIRIVKDGFEPRDLELTTRHVIDGRVDVTLTEIDVTPVSITMRGRYPFEVFEGSTLRSPAKESHQLQLTGRHVLRVRSEQYFLNQAVSIDPKKGRQFEYDAPPLAQLTVRVARELETCTVYIDSLPIGLVPISNRAVVSGTRTIEVRCPDNKRVAKQAEIQPGQVHVERVP